MKSKEKKNILEYKEPITNIYLIRHGETDANKKKLIFGHLDHDLNKAGIAQSKVLSKKLKLIIKNHNEQIHNIISSPLKRAKNTAKFIASELNTKKITVDKNLMEKSEGIWEGKTYIEIEKKDPKSFYKWTNDIANFKPKHGESISDLYKRVKAFHSYTLKRYQNKNLIVVSHAGFIQLFILFCLNAPKEKLWSIETSYCSVSKISISKNLSCIKYFNFL